VSRGRALALRRRLASLLAAPALLAAACIGERERLDVPRVALDVENAAPVPGGRVTGVVAASDASGLISLAVYACTGDSTFRQTRSYDRAREGAIDFELHVASTAALGDPLELYAVAFDDQGFAADSALVLRVGGGADDPAAGAGLCTRPRPAGSVTLPTAPGP